MSINKLCDWGEVNNPAASSTTGIFNLDLTDLGKENMAVTLVLSQVIGQAFVIKPSGEILQAKPRLQITTGDVICVIEGKNAWLVTEAHTQIDVLNDTLFINDKGLHSLDLPYDLLESISAIKENQDSIENEVTETHTDKDGNDPQDLNKSNRFAYSQGTNGNGIGKLDTCALKKSGLTEQQSNSFIRVRYGSRAPSEKKYTPPTLDNFSISSDKNTDFTLYREDILPFITRGNRKNIYISNVTSGQDSANILNKGDGSFVIHSPDNFNTEMAFDVFVTDGIATANATMTITSKYQVPLLNEPEKISDLIKVSAIMQRPPNVTKDLQTSVKIQTSQTIELSSIFIVNQDISNDITTFSSTIQPIKLNFSSRGFNAILTNSDGQLNNNGLQTIELGGASYPISPFATVQYRDADANIFTMAVLSVGAAKKGNYYAGATEDVTLLLQMGGPVIVPTTALSLVENSYSQVSAIHYFNVNDSLNVASGCNVTSGISEDISEGISEDLGTQTITDKSILDESSPRVDDDIIGSSPHDNTFALLDNELISVIVPRIARIHHFDTQNDTLNLSDLLQNKTLENVERYLSLLDDEQGDAMLKISSKGDGQINHKVIFDKMSVQNIATAYNLDTDEMTPEQMSSSVINTMIIQSKVIIN